jgi:hypothetical protein
MPIVTMDIIDYRHNAICFLYLRDGMSQISFSRCIVSGSYFFSQIPTQKYNVGQINSTELTDAIWRNFFQGKLTFTHWNKGCEAMAPIVTAAGGTFLVRKLANLSPT